MRGSPLLHAVLLAAVLALAGIPVWSLTRPHVHAVESKAGPADTARQAVDLAITTTAPARITLSLEGRVVWQNGIAGSRFEETLDLPTTGAELVATVEWTGGENHAARFEFVHDGEKLAETTLWGDAETTDVIPLPSSP